MKRLVLFVLAMCLLLTACGTEPEPEVQEPEMQETETQEPETQETEVQQPETSEPDIQEEISPVYTDWSKLTPYKEESVYSYYIPRSENGFLQPQDDYGVLLEYTGKIIGTYDKDIHLRGLVTADGRIVTEPVYRSVYVEGAFMILDKSKFPSGNFKGWDDYISNYTIAAPDGSWVKDIGLGIFALACGDDLLVILKEDHSFITLNKDGDIVSEISGDVLRSYYGEESEWIVPYPSMYNDARCLVFEKDDADKLYLDAVNGTVLNELPEWYTPNEDYYDEESTVGFPGYESVYEIIDSITGTIYYIGYNFNGTARDDLLDETGKLIFEDFNIYNYEVTDGFVSTMRYDYFCYYSVETGKLVFKYPIQRSNAE